jgi:AFG3 family protein
MENEENNDRPKFNYYWIYGIIALVLISWNFFNLSSGSRTIDEKKIEKLISDGDVKQIIVVNQRTAEIYINPDSLGKDAYKDIERTTLGIRNVGPHFSCNIGPAEGFRKDIQTIIDKAGNKPQLLWEDRQSIIGPILSWILPLVLLIAVWMFIMRRMGGGAGGGGSQIFNIGKSKATLFDKDGRVNITFKDVAGLDEAKEEVVEVVDFLRNPKKYTSLGGKIPKGVLLVGSPGTGKTLLAKAVAGEAGVPFFSISGSDFVEMFVGVGASRVRDLFKQARDKAPCIIFIDEIDAIGRARGRNAMNGNDERENTLNQLLVEMDGFATDKGVIIMAATNRVDILDAALTRPGRFDRRISIDLPDLVGREQIFAVHLKNIKTTEALNLRHLAQQTAGFAGADIANLCNEAALIAARRGKKAVDLEDFNDAIDRVIGGLERRNKVIPIHKKRTIAYHEAGHAVVSWYLEHAPLFVKVTIVPRGDAGGYARYAEATDAANQSEAELLDQICLSMGGRAAEDIIFNKLSSGAVMDLAQSTKVARAMVAILGMSPKIGHTSYYDPQGEYQFVKPFSEQTAQLIDEEIRQVINNQYLRAKQILKERRNELELVTEALLNKEVLLRDDIENLIGKRPFDDVPDESNGEKAAGENNGSNLLRDTAENNTELI